MSNAQHHLNKPDLLSAVRIIDWLVGWLPGGVGGLHLVWVPAVGPEEEQPVEQRLDVGHV